MRDPDAPYVLVRARRQRVLDALPTTGTVRPIEITRRLGVDYQQIQDDLRTLAASGQAQRVQWGHWRRASATEKGHGE